MTGTSMDGLDIAYCHFHVEAGKWSHEVKCADCIPHPKKWKLRLENLVLQNAVTYLKTDTFFGHYIGNTINEFIAKNELEGDIDYIASHGQTIFHQPEKLLTSQIGDGAAIAAVTGIPTVCNFRTVDVALGGQGAPIAPIGDLHLYPGYDFFLNLGGIVNIAARTTKGMIAYDISGCNLLLNKFAEGLGHEFDQDGVLARSGMVDYALLEELNNSWYFEKEYPKSLSAGWVSKIILPMFRKHDIPTEDKLATVVEHIAFQVSKNVDIICHNENIVKSPDLKMLVTGGGAFNSFLIERMQDRAPSIQIETPDEVTIKFKEAVIMAFIGILRVRGEVNCLSSVTGANRDSIGGELYY